MLCKHKVGSSNLSGGTKFKYIMTDKKSKNPFINLANAAKAVAANPRVPGTKTAQVQAAKHGGQVSTNKPAKKSAGRGR
jgi:hypothetical protein